MRLMEDWERLHTGEEAAKAGRIPWKTWDEYIDAYWNEVKRRIRRIRDSRWSIGFKDRGHGHGDFAVLASSGRLLVAEVETKELAQMLIKQHNSHLTPKK